MATWLFANQAQGNRVASKYAKGAVNPNKPRIQKKDRRVEISVRFISATLS